MANQVRYIRNRRPNMLKIKLYARTPNQVVFPLERRGHPADCIAVPEEAFTDHSFLKTLRTGAVEEITQETFMALALRVDQNPPQAPLVERVNHGVQSAFDPEVHLKTGLRWEVEGEEMFNAYEVPEFDKELMKPRLEFENITDSEDDAQQALRDAGMLPEEEVEDDEVDEVEVAPPAPVARKKPVKKGALKYDDLTRKNSPRKKTTKGVVGGDTIEAMEDE